MSEADSNRKKEKSITTPTLPEFPGISNTNTASEIPATFEVEVDRMLGQPFFQLVSESASNPGITYDITESAVGVPNNSNQSSFTGKYIDSGLPLVSINFAFFYLFVFSFVMSAFQEDVLLQLKTIQDVQVAQSNLLQSILRKLEDRDKMEETSYKFPRDQFPVKTTVDLDQLDKLICDNPGAYTNLVLITANLYYKTF